MADRTTNKIYKTLGGDGTHSWPIADGVTIGVGALVQLESGYLNHWNEAGVFAGLMLGGDARAGDAVFIGETSDSPPPRGIVDISGRIVSGVAVAGSVTIADQGALVYCADSDMANLTKTDTTNPPVGVLLTVRSASDCDVKLFSLAEHLAGNAGATWAS